MARPLKAEMAETSLERNAPIFIRGAKIGGLLVGSVSQVKAEMLRLSQHFRSQDSYRRAAAKYLFQELRYYSFDKTWLRTVAARTYFRRVGQNRDVLDTAGSLSDGGRFNIGGAQASSIVTLQLGALGQKRSALYVGEDPDVVRREFGDAGMPGSTAVTYQLDLRRKSNLNLIDIRAVLDSLPIPDLKVLIGSASMNGKWGDIKYPMPCQILGHWLMANAPKRTDGIRFPTTHGGDEWNVCLFFADTRACKRTFKTSLLPEGD